MTGSYWTPASSWNRSSPPPSSSSGRLAAADAVEFLDLLPQLGVDLEFKLEPPLAIFEASMRSGAQAYDSMYLVLAEAMRLPIASVDGGMKTAARALNIPVHESLRTQTR